MGNRISYPSSMFTSSSPDHEQRVPKHLRPGKASKKQRQEARQQLQLQRPGHHHHQALGRPDPNDIGIAIAYPPDVPVFMFDPGKNDFVLNNKHMHGKTPPSSTLSEKHMQNQYSRHAPRQSTKKQLPTPPPTSDTAPRQRKFSVVTSMTSVNQLCKQQLPNDAGPMNAFEWFNGRRYPKQMGLMMPNDQQELDRIRVLNYILRWAFQGDIVAPVTSQLTQGTQVLNIG
ncbi:hypothetical protein BC940DRAFT_334599 [Gongronella butleri]|nr:hypothetical protein BC940DRAFT_334599 [Gongronella butleri]